MPDKPARLKGNSDVEWSYNIIAEWLSSDIVQAATKPDRDSLAVLQALIYAVLTTARQAAAQDAYERACKAMCGHCRRPVAVECLPVHGWVHFVNDGSQPRGEAGRYADCQAAAIRSLAAAEAGKEGEKCSKES